MTTANTESQLEAMLMFKNEPISISDLVKVLDASVEDVKRTVESLQDFYNDRGIVLVTDGEYVSFGTHPDQSQFIESVKKDEYSRDLGKASLETLAIILYKGPVSRKEIDHIRGVNSSYILRTLMIRGLVERTDPSSGSGRSFIYKPTLELYRFLGVTKKEDLPEYVEAYSKLEEFAKTSEENNVDE